MSSQSKFLTIGLILAFGIGNAYYAFNPSLKELKERREAASSRDSKSPESQRLSLPQTEPDRPKGSG
ncbi:hypothetical protein VTK56DRAFT_530 [Thermocarpiscus australiensis]